MPDGLGGNQVTGPLQNHRSVIHSTLVPTQLRLSQALTAEKAGREREREENVAVERGRSPAAQSGRRSLEQTGRCTKQ